MPLKPYVILRSAQRARLEGRIFVVQHLFLSEFERLDDHRLVLCGGDPFLHPRHPPDRVAISFGLALKIGLVGAKTGGHPGAHRIPGGELARQEPPPSPPLPHAPLTPPPPPP